MTKKTMATTMKTATSAPIGGIGRSFLTPIDAAYALASSYWRERASVWPVMKADFSNNPSFIGLEGAS
jgi:hypothetical protein